MAKGLTYLIDTLNQGDSKSDSISLRSVVGAIKEGMRTEPKKFPLLVEALQARLERAYKWSPDEARQRALGNIASFALLADHDYESKMMRSAALGGPKSVAEWYDKPKEYGAAMTAFVEYVGVKGPSLREFILDL